MLIRSQRQAQVYQCGQTRQTRQRLDWQKAPRRSLLGVWLPLVCREGGPRRATSITMPAKGKYFFSENEDCKVTDPLYEKYRYASQQHPLLLFLLFIVVLYCATLVVVFACKEVSLGGGAWLPTRLGTLGMEMQRNRVQERQKGQLCYRALPGLLSRRKLKGKVGVCLSGLYSGTSVTEMPLILKPC